MASYAYMRSLNLVCPVGSLCYEIKNMVVMLVMNYNNAYIYVKDILLENVLYYLKWWNMMAWELVCSSSIGKLFKK